MSRAIGIAIQSFVTDIKLARYGTESSISRPEANAAHKSRCEKVGINPAVPRPCNRR